jgi:hypothetical protein
MSRYATSPTLIFALPASFCVCLAMDQTVALAPASRPPMDPVVSTAKTISISFVELVPVDTTVGTVITGLGFAGRPANGLRPAAMATVPAEALKIAKVNKDLRRDEVIGVTFRIATNASPGARI